MKFLDHLLCEFVFLLIKLLRGDLLYEDQFVFAQKKAQASLARLNWSCVDLPYTFRSFGFPAKMSVEINKEAEIYKEETYEDQEGRHSVRSLYHIQANSGCINKGL